MKDLSHFAKALRKFGEEIVEEAQIELNTTQTIDGRKVKRVASGNLKQSLYSRVYIRKGKAVMSLGGAEYGIFVHEGVNGTQRNNGSRFSFKSKMVNVGAIEGWIKSKPIRLRKTKKNKYGQKVNVFVEKNEANIKSASIAIAKSIAKRGIVGLPFYQLAYDKVWRNYEKKLAEAMAEDALEILK